MKKTKSVKGFLIKPQMGWSKIGVVLSGVIHLTLKKTSSLKKLITKFKKGQR